MLVLLVALAVGGVLVAVKRRYDGRFRGSRRTHSRPERPDRPDPGPGLRLGPDDIGAELGERVTLLQFSSAFCAPCRATRRILGEVAGMVDGVVHVEVDAESRLDLVRRLGILRTPTVLVLDRAGLVVRRASGQPRTADVIAAVGQAADHDRPHSDQQFY